jgi:hypothetical protein
MGGMVEESDIHHPRRPQEDTMRRITQPTHRSSTLRKPALARATAIAAGGLLALGASACGGDDATSPHWRSTVGFVGAEDEAPEAEAVADWEAGALPEDLLLEEPVEDAEAFDVGEVDAPSPATQLAPRPALKPAPKPAAKPAPVAESVAGVVAPAGPDEGAYWQEDEAWDDNGSDDAQWADAEWASDGWADGEMAEEWAEADWELEADWEVELGGAVTWFDHPQHGRVCRPVDGGWSPYRDGYWQEAAVGPVWVGATTLESRTAHYGEWIWDAGVWVWIPGRAWRPAAVVWVETTHFVGWAPAGRGGRVARSDGWRFVRAEGYGRRDMRRYAVSPAEVAAAGEAVRPLPAGRRPERRAEARGEARPGARGDARSEERADARSGARGDARPRGVRADAERDGTARRPARGGDGPGDVAVAPAAGLAQPLVSLPEPALPSPQRVRPAGVVPPHTEVNPDVQARIAEERFAEAQARRQAKAAAADAERLAKAEAEAAARLEANRAAQVAAEAKARHEAELAAKAEAERLAKAEAEAAARLEANRAAQVAAEAKARHEAELAAKARVEAERRAKAEAEARARLEANRAAQAAAEAKARHEAELAAKAKAEGERRAKVEAAAKARAESESRAEAERRAKAEADARAAAEQRVKARAAAKARAEAESRAKAEGEEKAASERLARATPPERKRAPVVDDEEAARKGPPPRARRVVLPTRTR